MHKYIYIAAFGPKNPKEEPDPISFAHSIIEANDEQEAYNLGDPESLRLQDKDLESFVFLNDYVIRLPEAKVSHFPALTKSIEETETVLRDSRDSRKDHPKKE